MRATQFFKKDKAFKFLKKIDIFSVPMKTYFHRHDSEQKTINHHERLGSYFGGSVSILFVLGMLFYSLNLVIKMFNGEDDIVNRMVITNPLVNPSHRKIDVNKEVFLPYIRMDLQDWTYDPSTFDIWNDDG